MGSILTNGVFLPAEGERNCYEGLAANWVALDGMIGGYSSHAANLTIHVTAADKEAWNGKADTSALTAHTGNATIHVTAADKQTWGTVTTKANDANVVHTSGNETVDGQKVFTDINAISSSAEIGVSAGNNSFKVLDKNKKTISRYEGGTFSGGMAYSYLLVNNGSDVFNGVSLYQSSANLAQLRPYSSTLSLQLGASNRYFSDCYTSKINGITPSSLSMPATRGTVDISGYVTDLTGVNINNYTPLANGYIVITCNSNDVDYIKMSNNLDFVSVVDNTNNQFTSGILGAWQPCVAGIGVQIRIKASALNSAKFIPCQGNA